MSPRNAPLADDWLMIAIPLHSVFPINYEYYSHMATGQW